MQNADYSEQSSDADENKVIKSPSSFDYRVTLFNTEVCPDMSITNVFWLMNYCTSLDAVYDV